MIQIVTKEGGNPEPFLGAQVPRYASRLVDAGTSHTTGVKVKLSWDECPETWLLTV